MKKMELHQLDIQNDDELNDCRTIAKVMNPLLADTFALFVKTKNFHWHMSGPHFRDYHLLLDEQSEQIYAMIDVLAERVRKLGEETIHSIGHIKELQSIRDENELLPAEKMLRHLLHDNKVFLKEMRFVHEVCSKKKDVASTSLLEVYIDETERRIWFLSKAVQHQ